MKLTRRGFIKTTVAIGAGAVGAVGAAAASAKEALPVRGSTVEDTTAEVVRWFGAKGFVPVAAAPLISGHSFNGGLNFDDHLAEHGEAQYVVQPCSRVEDVRKKDVPGTLPLFTIFGFDFAERTPKAERLKHVVGFLTGPAGLDPGRLRATTTKLAEHLFPTLAELGIDAGRIRLQPIEKAKREGAGSGYFAPVGHPHQPAYASLSIECVMADGSELEVAEISAEPDGPHSVRGAIGLDRVVMARSDRPITWSERLPVFKDAVEQDARRRGVPLPVGYYEMLGLPPPGASKAG